MKTLEKPINKGGCNGLRITFSSDVECMQERSDPTVADQNATQHGHRDRTCLQAAVWKLWHWRAIVAWSMPAELLTMLIFPSGGAQQPHKHGIGYKTKREGSQCSSSPIIKHFFVSLFAVVHGADYAPISLHRAQGAFIHKGATAERCIMVMCPQGRSWYRGFWDRKGLIGANVTRAPWAPGFLEGRRREGAFPVQQRRQRSAAMAEVASALGLRGATNAHLSVKLDVAKQAANDMSLKEVDKFFCRPAHLSSVVTTTDEDGEIDILARPGIRLGAFCAPRIFL